MAHQLDFSNNRANFAYVGEAAWHKLGHQVQEDATLDQWRIAAGLNWEAVKTPINYQTPNGLKQDEDNVAIYRNDTDALLGLATKGYQILQPKDVIDFYADLCKDHGFKLETAGSLYGGKRIWALAKTPENFAIKGQDRVDGYCLLATSFDSSSATRAQFTSVRVVCNNTLSLAYKNKDFVSVKHSTIFNHQKVKFDLGIVGNAFSCFENDCNILADKGVDQKQAVRFLIDLLEGKDVEVKDLSTRKANIIQQVYSKFAGKGVGSELRSAKGTLWGLVNAVTEYVDHEQGHTVESRFNSSQFGTGGELKRKAFSEALKLAA